MTEAAVGTYDRFAARADDFGAEVTRLPADEATGAIEAAIKEPAVGAPLPWDDVSLPRNVETDPTPADLDASVTGVTAASLGIADYGSIVLRATPDGVEPVSLFPDHHVAVLREADLVPDMAAAFERLGEELRDSRGSAVLATGPSATADMGELVKGAHGPKTVDIVVLS